MPDFSQPLQPAAATQHTDPLSTATQRKLIWAFLAIGIAARTIRYLLCFPLWEDECFLAVNYIDASYSQLLGALQLYQMAPVLFLWIELTAVKLFGFAEMPLRLFPFLCSIAGLFLFRHLAGRLLQGTALVAAVAIFSVSYPGIRYAAEAKQYSSDLLAALLLLTFSVEYWRSGRRAWLWALTVIGPLLLWLSYPAALVAGGVSLVLLAVIWQRSQRRAWWPWLAYNTLLAVSFLGMFALSASRQARDGFMETCWQSAFPPITAPLEMPQWLLLAHTGDLLAFPVGGGNGASTVTFLLCVIGIAALVRTRHWLGLAFCAAPFAVHFAAAAMQRYPYGGAVKFSMHLAPLICLLAGFGLAASIMVYLARRPAARWPIPLWFSLLALIGLGSIARDVAHPYKTLSDERARAFAEWFWFNAGFEGEAVCVKSDLHLDFSPKTYSELGWATMYLVNRAIYAPATPPQQQTIDYIPTPPDEPLRCLVYRDPRWEFDESALQKWLNQMQQQYKLASHETFAFPRYDKGEQRHTHTDTLEVYKFLPRGANDSALVNKPAVPAAKRR